MMKLNLKLRSSSFYSNSAMFGDKSIKGTVTKSGIAFPCRVTLLERLNDRLIAQVMTDNNGNYAFNNLSAGFEFSVLAHDHQRQKNAVIQDSVVPK